MSAPLETPFGPIPCVLADSHWCRREPDRWTLSVLRIDIKHAPLRWTAQVASGMNIWEQSHGTTPEAACRALRRRLEQRSAAYSKGGAYRRVLDRCLELTEVVDVDASAA